MDPWCERRAAGADILGLHRAAHNWAATGVLAGLSWSELASTALSSNGLGKDPKWASTRALEGSFAGPLLSYSERTVNTQ